MDNIIINIDETQDLNKWISKEMNYKLVFLNYSFDSDFQKKVHQLTINSENKCSLLDMSFVNEGKWKNNYRYINKCFSDKKIDNDGLFFFPDPDLEMPVDEINKFLNYAREHRWEICQPSLTQDSFCTYDRLKSKPNIDFRPSFVELMCPCFSTKGLSKALWTFNLNYSGYGLDLLWEKLLNGYVADKFQIRHPREPNYRKTAAKAGFPDPKKELREIKRLYL